MTCSPTFAERRKLSPISLVGGKREGVGGVGREGIFFHDVTRRGRRAQDLCCPTLRCLHFTACILPPTFYRLHSTACILLPAFYCALSVVDSRRRTLCCLLSTAYCVLPVTSPTVCTREAWEGVAKLYTSIKRFFNGKARRM